jgi:hypothetical protein
VREREVPRSDAPGAPAARAARAARRVAPLLSLQRTAGNRAALRLLRKGRTTADFEYRRAKTVGNKGGGWFVKTPRADKEKPKDHPTYTTEWLIKKGGGYGETSNDLAGMFEVMGAQMFAALAGERWTGKHRIVTGPAVEGLEPFQAPSHWVASKTVTGLTTWQDMTDEDRAARTKGVVPGLGRLLVVSMLIGDSDWNLGNFGFAPGTEGEPELRKIDFGMAFKFGLLPLVDVRDRRALLEAFKLDHILPEAVDPKEVEATLAELEKDGKARIHEVIAGFSELLAGEEATEQLTDIQDGLLDRLAKLCG